MPGEEKVAVLRVYLDRWHWQVVPFINVPKNAGDAALREIAPQHPVFRILPHQRSRFP